MNTFSERDFEALHMSRRSFLAYAGVLAAGLGMPRNSLLAYLGAAPSADPPVTTLIQTYGASGTGFRATVIRPGEPFIVRGDLGVGPISGRRDTRRSLLYFAQHTDVHVPDTQNPSRDDPVRPLSPQFSAASHPQDAAHPRVLNDMVKATNQARVSPVTGAPMAFFLETGDQTDVNCASELWTFKSALDAGTVDIRSGGPIYQGPASWDVRQSAWYYHPNDPAGDEYGRHGYLAYRNLVDVSLQPFEGEGAAVPWYAILGNHDVLWDGNWIERSGPFACMRDSDKRITDAISTLAFTAFGILGSRPQDVDQFIDLATSYRSPISPGIEFDTKDLSVIEDQLREQWSQIEAENPTLGWKCGFPWWGKAHEVTPDPERRRSVAQTYVQELLTSDPAHPGPGPLGHGFTDASISNNETWWFQDFGPVRLIGLDTNNYLASRDHPMELPFGSLGRMNDRQFNWLEERIREVSTQYFVTPGNLGATGNAADKLIVIASHHNTWTLVPGKANKANGLTDLFLRYPNVIIWINGHSHFHVILPHPAPRARGHGFWEVNTGALNDFPQQGRLVELVDNRDGTLSIFTICLDHAGGTLSNSSAITITDPAQVSAVSRRLAINDPYGGTSDPIDRAGYDFDRNCELLVKAPFDLGSIPDKALARRALARRARHARQIERSQQREEA